VFKKIENKHFTLFINKIIPASFVFSENTTCQSVVLVVCACIQNTIHLFIVLVLTFRVSKPIKISLRFTNNIVPKLTQCPAFEVRKKNVYLMFTYLEVFSRAVRILHSFPVKRSPLAQLCSTITDDSVYLWRKTGICKMFLKAVSIVSLSFHIVIKGSYSYRLRTTTLSLSLSLSRSLSILTSLCH